jgi:hypothetical protein
MAYQDGPAVAASRPGEHLCVLYRGATERDRVMAAYLAEGVRSGHACLCAADARVLAAVGGPQISALDAPDDRLPRRPLGTGLIPRRIREWARTTFERERHPGARVVTDANWALSARPSLDDVAEYEAEIGLCAQLYPQTVLCMYDLDRSSTIVHAVIRAHSRVWMHEVVLENPYSPGIRRRRVPGASSS